MRAENATALHFSVRYRIGEYLRFVGEHAFATDPALSGLRGLRRLAAGAMLLGVAACAFVWKMHRVGTCRFSIDAEGISRQSRRGTGSVPWARVKAVHICSPGYLIELEHGAMPVPYRVLDTAQQHMLRRFAGTRLVMPGAAGGDADDGAPLHTDR